MNDLHTRRNEADLEAPVVSALEALMDTAPAPRSEPTDAKLLGRDEPADHRARALVVTAAAGVLSVGVAGLVIINQPEDPGVSQPAPRSSVSGPAASAPAPPITEVSDDPLADLIGFVLPAYVPDGYQITNLNAMPVYWNPDTENTDIDAIDTEVGVATDILLARTDGQPGGFITMSSLPHANGETLDTLLLGRDGFERQVIGGIERNVRIDRPDSLGPFTNVEWIEGDRIFTVAGRAPSDEVKAVAEGLSQSTRTDFLAAGASITDSAAALDVLDKTTFADGTIISVRSLTPGTSGSGAVAMCVESPARQCRFSFSEAGLGGAYQDSLIAAFDVDGDTMMFVWHNAAEAERLGEFTLQPTGPGVASTIPSEDPTPRSVPGSMSSTAEITEQVTTDVGRFIRINVPAGEGPPQLMWDVATGPTAISTAAPNAYGF